MLLLLYFFFVITNSTERWDLNYPCQNYIKKLAESQSKMAYCATIHSLPPKVCTNCFEEYVNFKQMEYMTHHLDNVFSVDNKTCKSVIYDNYLLSYGNELSISLTNKIWENSRCDSCLIINWDLFHMNSTVEYNQKTIDFQSVLYNWRNCIVNSTKLGDNLTLCQKCEKAFNSLFDYYWKIYTEPGIEFCLDIETTMNDTMNAWHNLWMCPDDTRTIDRNIDVTVVVFSATILSVIIVLFYSGSYIQTEISHINLIQYSHLVAPTSRYRLLSSSTDSQNIQSTNSSN